MATRRTDRLDVCVSTHEKEAAREMAARRGVTMSALVRALLGAALREERKQNELIRATYPDRG